MDFQVTIASLCGRECVFLHGVGARGTDNEKQVNVLPKTFASAENQAKRPSIVIATSRGRTQGHHSRRREA